MSNVSIKEGVEREFGNNSLICNLAHKYFEEESEDFDDILNSYIQEKINEIN
jgi:hypothetical protein